jgi:hypothetical protein
MPPSIDLVDVQEFKRITPTDSKVCFIIDLRRFFNNKGVALFPESVKTTLDWPHCLQLFSLVYNFKIILPENPLVSFVAGDR